MNILKTLCNIHSPSGEEYKMRDFLIDYINSSKYWWKKIPKLIYSDALQDNLIVVIGKPKTVLIAHMDTVGFTVRYDKELIPLGSPVSETGYKLLGEDSIGNIECLLHKNNDEYNLSYIYKRIIKPGTNLVFKPDFRLTADTIQSPYLDNRLGIWILLKLAETLNNGIIAFTCLEEQGGGSVQSITNYIYDKFKVQNFIIADTTHTSEGIHHNNGSVISLRDEYIPRKKFVDIIKTIAESNNIDYQLEVEYSGGSDGASIQKSPYPVNWCFVGPPISNIHSPDEIVNKNDIFATLKLYHSLMDNL